MRKKHYKEAIRILLQLLSPFAPFITHELWEKLGGNTMISAIPWPVYNREYIQRDIITCVIQINSKIRDRLELPVNMSQHEVKEKALQSVKIQKYLKDTRIKKEIFIKNKLINFVVEPL